jgi:hypothetical protein
MPTTIEEIEVAIEDATRAGFRGRLLAQGEARALLWRDGALPDGAPNFSPGLGYDLATYGYSLLSFGLRLRELGGDDGLSRRAFEQAATALEAMAARDNPQKADHGFHRVVAAASYHLAGLSARAYSFSLHPPTI